MTDIDRWQTALLALPEITPELLDILDERYASPPEPTECRVCGGPMVIGELGANGTKWSCAVAGRKLLKPGFDRDAARHYDQSKVHHRSSGDPFVRALVAAYRSREARDAEDECSGSSSSTGSPS